MVSVSAPISITYAQDSFGRTVVGDWGTADIGGAYTAAGGGSALNVVNGVGQIAPPRAGATRGVTLNSVSARDVDIKVRIAIDKQPTGNTVWVYEAARHNGNNEYRPKILLRPDGTVAVHAGVVVSDSESPIGNPVTIPGLTDTPGTFIWLRAQVTGINPTTIRIRAWADGQAEPTTWQYTGTEFEGPATDRRLGGSARLHPWLGHERADHGLVRRLLRGRPEWRRCHVRPDRDARRRGRYRQLRLDR